MTIVVSLFLVFAGCDSSSTDSDSDDNNNNGNQNQSASFESGPIGPDETFSHTFEEEETVDYYCTIHAPDMTGEIIVTSNAEAVERDTVSMENDQFNPSSLEVAPNTEVVWVNNQEHNHDIKTGTPSSNDDGGDPDY